MSCLGCSLLTRLTWAASVSALCPGGTIVKNLPVDAGDVRDAGSIPESGRSPGEEMVPTPIFLPREFHGQRSLLGYSPWDHKRLDTTEQLSTTHRSNMNTEDIRVNLYHHLPHPAQDIVNHKANNYDKF